MWPSIKKWQCPFNLLKNVEDSVIFLTQKVSDKALFVCKSDVAIFALRVTWNYAYSPFNESRIAWNYNCNSPLKVHKLNYKMKADCVQNYKMKPNKSQI